MTEETIILSTGRVLPAAAVAAHQRTIKLIASENQPCLHRLVRCADKVLIHHLPEADMWYLSHLGLIEADGRLHRDFRDVLASSVTWSSGC